jgi:tetratricopeptide (TPR) repeat protein
MFNVSEVTTLMVRLRQARTLAIVAAATLAGGAFATADAQQRGQPTPTTPRLVVVNFRSVGADKGAGVAAADAARDRLMREFSARSLWVIPRKDIDTALKQSGYPTDEPLNPNDARTLANLMRADEYVDGVVLQQDGQYKVEARLVLSRNLDLAQPLPVQTVSKPGDAGAAIAKAVKDAREQLDSEKACYSAATANKNDEAIAAGRKAIEAYPQSTLGRLCILNVLSRAKAAPDTLLALAEEILAIDPRSRAALGNAYEAQKALGKNDEALNTLVRLLAADPGNATVQTAVVRELALSKKFDMADSVVTAALEDNPREPDLLRMAFPVYIAAERWKKAAAVGEDVARVDTAFATETFFPRLAAAYVNDSQPQKAAEAIARGVAKFPNSTALLVDAADVYRQAGQLQQAVSTLQRALQANPKAPGANLTLAQIYVDMQQPDSALTTLRAAAAAGDSVALVAGIAAQIGQQAFTASRESKALSDYTRAVSVLSLSDELYPNNKPVMFVLGVSAHSAAIAELQAAQKDNNCQMARDAKQHFGIVSRVMPAAGSVQPETAGQIMAQMQEYSPFADQMISSLCK